MRSLSGRLLLLTIIFVMIAEIFIFVPSVARFRADYLEERLARAQIAAAALLSAPEEAISAETERDLLDMAEARGIVFSRGEARELILAGEMPPPIDAHFNLTEIGRSA